MFFPPTSSEWRLKREREDPSHPDRFRALGTRLRWAGPLPPADAVGWTIRLAKRVERLHDRGVVHGDISASCVMTRGIAVESEAMLGPTMLDWSPIQYHSPERLAGKAPTAATDTWAVAVFLYFLLTGHYPYDGNRAETLLRSMDAGDIRGLDTHDVDCDGLEAIVRLALGRPLSGRIVQVSALRRMLERWHHDPSAVKLAPLGASQEWRVVEQKQAKRHDDTPAPAEPPADDEVPTLEVVPMTPAEAARVALAELAQADSAIDGADADPPSQRGGVLSQKPSGAAVCQDLSEVRWRRLAEQIDNALDVARAESPATAPDTSGDDEAAADHSLEVAEPPEDDPGWRTWAFIVACAVGVEALALAFGWLLFNNV